MQVHYCDEIIVKLQQTEHVLNRDLQTKYPGYVEAPVYHMLFKCSGSNNVRVIITLWNNMLLKVVLHISLDNK